jgi:gliding motility-associated-like protein
VGQYSITVLDANSCEITGSAAIGQPDPVDIAVIDLQNLLCNAQPTGSVTVEGRGGVGPYEYSVDGVFFQVDPRFANLPAGDYEFTVMDANGCVQTTKARLTEPVALFVDAGQDQTIQLGQDARLRAIASQNGVRFEWTPGNTLNCVECPNPIARPTSTTSYTIVIRDDNNCEARDSVTISVSPIRPLYIPSGFSPNGDGINDYFTLFGGPGARQILLLRIFDRWGELVFETRNAPLGEEVSGWDGTLKGKPMNPNVFVYYAEVEFIDGAVVVYTGDLTLAR